MSRAAEGALEVLVEVIAEAVAAKLAEQKAPTAVVQAASEATSAWLTIGQVAVRLGVTKKTVEAWRAAGCSPPSVRIGRSVRFNPGDVDAWARTNPRVVGAKRKGAGHD